MRNCPSRLRRIWTSRIIAGAVVASLAGCAGSAQQSDPYATMADDNVVVSGSPNTDTTAYRFSARQLEEAHFDEIDAAGPQPKSGRKSTAGVIGANGEPEPKTIISSAPATQPATQPTSRPAVQAESRVALPEGRVRLIWDLQGFGSSRVTTSGSGGTSRRQITVEPADLAPLVQIIQAQLADAGTVVPLVNEAKLVIVCREEAEPGVLELLRTLDRPGKQVEITAKIFEVRHDFDYQQGARLLLNRVAEDGTQQALSTFSTQRLLDAASGGSPFQGSVLSLMQTLSDSGIGIEASFELLAEAGLVNVVSEPRLTVAEGQTGYMLAGRELPIQSAEFNNGTLKASTQYKPVGVQLYVTPQLVGDGHVTLHTVSVVSSIAGFTPLPTLRGGQASTPLLLNPVLESREAETNVTVAAGDTLVISGMRMVRTTTREDKIPGLGDLPLLGNLFKNHRTQRHMTDLYFFLTPRLVDIGAPIAMIE